VSQNRLKVNSEGPTQAVENDITLHCQLERQEELAAGPQEPHRAEQLASSSRKAPPPGRRNKLGALRQEFNAQLEPVVIAGRSTGTYARLSESDRRSVVAHQFDLEGQTAAAQ
jgi:hypothetical protein